MRDHPKDVLLVKGKAGTMMGGIWRRPTRAEWELEGEQESNRDGYWAIESVERYVPTWRSGAVLAVVAILTLMVATATLVVAIVSLTDDDPPPAPIEQEEAP